MAIFEIGKITIQSDKVQQIGPEEWDIISFKRALIACRVNDPKETSPFGLILDARANTLVINAAKCHRNAGNVAIALKQALRKLSIDKQDVMTLPPGAADAKEVVACGVTDAMHVAGLLHTLRDLGGFGEASTASLDFGFIE
jgi:hypothetical protein